MGGGICKYPSADQGISRKATLEHDRPIRSHGSEYLVEAASDAISSGLRVS